MDRLITHSHRLVLPADANHHGTLYAGALLRIALETAYVTAHRVVGDGANLMLRRVLSLECCRPAPVGAVIEICGAPLHLTRAYMVIGLLGTPLAPHESAWMDGLFGFVQVDGDGQPAPFPDETPPPVDSADWKRLRERMDKLLRIR